MGLNLWKVILFLRRILNLLPAGESGAPKIEFRPVVLSAAADPPIFGNGLNVTVFGTAEYQAWRNDDTLRSIIPDPANSVLVVFSGADAERFRKLVGMDRLA